MAAALNQDAVTAWSEEAKAIATQARVLSGEKLDQLVRRLQRHSGRSRESCWRFVMQTGLKIRDEHRRWTEAEIDALREHIATHTVEETAKMLGRSAKSVRCALHRYDLKIREIRCDWMSIDSLAQYSPCAQGGDPVLDREGLAGGDNSHARQAVELRHHAGSLPGALYAPSQRAHCAEENPQRGVVRDLQDLCFVPKHTIGTQLLSVRHDKQERADYAASQAQGGVPDDDDSDFEEEDDD